MRRELTQAELMRFVDYRPETGEFFYRLDGYNNVYRRGDKAGHSDGANGYLKMNIGGQKCRLHRLAWLYVYGEWPKQCIDHINGDRADNRIANLRDVPDIINSQNRRDAPSGSTGYRGVSRKPSGRYVAQITVNYKNIMLGLYDSPEEAHSAYMAAKMSLHAGHVL